MTTYPGRNKVFLIIIGTLLVANLAMLGFFLMNKDPQRKGRGDKREMIMDFLKKDIGFNPQQLAQYDTLNNRHREQMKPLFDSMKANKDQQFKVLSVTGYSDVAIDSLTKLSSVKQQHMDALMLRHFRDVRALCEPAQLPKFDTSFYKLFNRRGGDRPKK